MLLPVSGHRGLLLPLLVLALVAPPAKLPRCAGESAKCLAVYREGGAPAVFQSAHCPRWTLLPSGGEGDGGQSSPKGCHVATDRGRRRSQEDRTVCALGIRIPFIERMRIKEVDVGVVAVFDGHNGAEASQMASKLLLDYFLLHVYFLLDGIYSIMFRKSIGKLTNREIAILNDVFNMYKEDGSNHGEGELTKDHHPDREDERSRVEASGGYVLEWAGVYRVNGELALSRAIGDLPYKRKLFVYSVELH
ncbi:hypothetical protein PR202_ga22054 [Eleusine coracana subsp. coracana]|uniref:protein-serine/threonine phosphatase n=1 Tax=Eleusine coracana subsp. coracana TaxID=191504 RepID=A0AAV5D190_ELECO|nr:hypothetical protein PR202_ga22054 [Eleusine coracana subsp. coracana]